MTCTHRLTGDSKLAVGVYVWMDDMIDGWVLFICVSPLGKVIIYKTFGNLSWNMPFWYNL